MYGSESGCGGTGDDSDVDVRTSSGENAVLYPSPAPPFSAQAPFLVYPAPSFEVVAAELL